MDTFLKLCLALAIAGAVIGYVNLRNENDSLRAQIIKLNHACIPTDTGGGVMQCLQPNVRQTSGR